jgi:hypothetical protein
VPALSVATDTGGVPETKVNVPAWLREILCAGEDDLLIVAVKVVVVAVTEYAYTASEILTPRKLSIEAGSLQAVQA